MRRLSALIVIICTLLVCCSCGSADRITTISAPDDAHRLVVYTSHKAEVYEPIIREFEERTGIWVEVVDGGTNELLEWISEEQDDPRADVMFGGGVENLEACKYLFEPYRVSEYDAIEPSLRSSDDSWTPFSALPVVLIYNTKLIADGTLSGWEDLLSGTFDAHIAFASPALSGSCFTALAALNLALPESDTLPRFAHALAGIQLEKSGEILTQVADGSAMVGITLEESALKQIRAGSDIAIVYPEEGTACVPDGAALIRNCKHSDNARLFLDFISGQAVQELIVREFCRRSVRTDTPPAEELLSLSEIVQVPYDIAEISATREQLLADWEALIREEGGDTP